MGWDITHKKEKIRQCQQRFRKIDKKKKKEREMKE